MNSVPLPDGSRIAPWPSSVGAARSWLEFDAFWTLAELRRWRGESAVLASLRAFLSESLAAPDLTGWTDERVLSEIAQRLEDGRLIREREGADEHRGIAVDRDAVPEEAPPPPPKAAPPKAPPPPTVVATARFGPEAEGLRKAAEEGSAFYCSCDACLQAQGSA